MKVSVLIPVHMVGEEEGKWLTQAIQSVVDQTYQDWEIVVVNDASPRRVTWQKRTFGLDKGFPRAKDVMFYDMPRPPRTGVGAPQGVSAARNFAARMATGELLLPLDHDDFLEPDAITWLLEGWNNHGGLIYGDLKLFTSDHDAERTWKSKEGCNALLQDVVAWNTSLFSKADWTSVGGWNEQLKFFEDWDFNLRLIEHNICLNHISRVVAWYRQRPDSRMGRLKADANAYNQAYAALRAAHLEFFNGRLRSMCCGQQMPAAPPPSEPRRVQAAADRILVRYVGARQGSFGMRGPRTNVAYWCEGSGGFVTTHPDSKPGIDPADAEAILSMNGGKDFIKV